MAFLLVFVHQNMGLNELRYEEAKAENVGLESQCMILNNNNQLETSSQGTQQLHLENAASAREQLHFES